MKQKFKRLYMSMAENVSELSTAEKLKVGAVVVKDNRIISFGYNGTPSGWDNTCEVKSYYDGGDYYFRSDKSIKEEYPFQDEGGCYKLVTKPEVLHAEANALMKLARSSENSEKSSLFITHSPCIHCAKMIYQAGITSIFFKHRYRDDSGINFLNKAKLYVEEIKDG